MFEIPVAHVTEEGDVGMCTVVMFGFAIFQNHDIWVGNLLSVANVPYHGGGRRK
jgi:hypothetical protein